ncbi:hypothetical protein MMC14_009675 [Varicellaria rhodocarpa]|nr:hypothetical protein [Varicellaria rhodocarpa]
MGFAISNFLLDLMVIVLPIPKLWSLHMRTGRKIAVTGILSLGLVGFAGCIARLVIYLQIAAKGPSLTTDFFIQDTESVFWSNLEAGLSLLAINLPSLSAYFSDISSERIIASIRSLLLLTSLRRLGYGSGGSSTRTRIPDEGSSSQARLTADVESGEVHALHILQSKGSDGITIVRNSFDQREQRIGSRGGE